MKPEGRSLISSAAFCLGKGKLSPLCRTQSLLYHATLCQSITLTINQFTLKKSLRRAKNKWINVVFRCDNFRTEVQQMGEVRASRLMMSDTRQRTLAIDDFNRYRWLIAWRGDTPWGERADGLSDGQSHREVLLTTPLNDFLTAQRGVETATLLLFDTSWQNDTFVLYAAIPLNDCWL